MQRANIKKAAKELTERVRGAAVKYTDEKIGQIGVPRCFAVVSEKNGQPNNPAPRCSENRGVNPRLSALCGDMGAAERIGYIGAPRSDKVAAETVG